MKQAVINLELTGRCNRRCIVCPHGSENEIVKKDISLEDFEIFLKRAEEAKKQNLFIREIINSGYGENSG